MRVKTKGCTPFVESLGVVDDATKQTTLNYTGDSTGKGWTAVLQEKGGTAGASSEPLPGQELEGVDEDEWDD